MGLRISAHFMQDVTGNLFHKIDGRFIPIHASRVGCDKSACNPFVLRGCFNPRIPCGMRRGDALRAEIKALFQSTHPVWDATRFAQWDIPRNIVSIHASRVGCDPALERLIDYRHQFQSTHPVWDATRAVRNGDALIWFQSTHPVWDATSIGVLACAVFAVSIHASRVGCDK